METVRLFSHASDVQTGYLLITVAWCPCYSYCPANREAIAFIDMVTNGGQGETVTSGSYGLFLITFAIYACYCTNTRQIGRGSYCRNRDSNQVMKGGSGMLAFTQHSSQNFFQAC